MTLAWTFQMFQSWPRIDFQLTPYSFQMQIELFQFYFWTRCFCCLQQYDYNDKLKLERSSVKSLNDQI